MHSQFEMTTKNLMTEDIKVILEKMLKEHEALKTRRRSKSNERRTTRYPENKPSWATETDV